MWACSRASRPTSRRISSGCTISRRCSGPTIRGPAWSADRGVGSGEGGCCMDDVREWPACRKCQQGLLIPLSDYGRDGAPITYKAWVCSRSEEHTSELQSQSNLVCRLLLEKNKKKDNRPAAPSLPSVS